MPKEILSLKYCYVNDNFKKSQSNFFHNTNKIYLCLNLFGQESASEFSNNNPISPPYSLGPFALN